MPLFTALLVLGCTGEVDPSDNQLDEETDRQLQQLEERSDSASADTFEQSGSLQEHRAAWPYNFEQTSDGLKSTILAVGDVQLNSDGTLRLEQSPYQTVSGEVFDSPWSYELNPRLIGRQGRLAELSDPQEATHAPSSASFEYQEGARLEYRHHHDGLKLYFHIDEKPAGEGPVEVRFDQQGRSLDVHSDENEVHAYHDGDEAFRWQGLVAYDAEDTSVPVEMSTDGDSLRFQVDDTDASYPVTIDPVATDPDWTSSGSQSESDFGNRVATADVNDNGHTDILIADPRYSGNENNQGRVLLYLGDADGFSASADVILAGDTSSEQVGSSPTIRPDFSGDGCGELLVGAPGYDGFRGRLLHYQLFDCEDDDTEPAPELIESVEGEVDTIDFYGTSLTVGHFACDEELSVAVGVPNMTGEDDDGDEYDFSGGIEVFHNDPDVGTPLADDPDFTYSPEESDVRIGRHTTTVPEVRGRDYNTPERCEGFAAGTEIRDDFAGAVYIFEHDEDGNFESSPTLLEGDEDDGFGSALSTIPSPQGNEIDGHQLSGIVVGATPVIDDTRSGYVSIYEYNEAEDSFEEVWHDTGPHEGSEFGTSVAGHFDLNDDGHYDLVVGATNYNADTDDGAEGGAFIYLGTEDDLNDEPDMILDSGQTDSEFGYEVSGIEDYIDDANDALVVGARSYDGLVDDGGKVFVYPGQDNCYIDGEFYTDGAANPDNNCEICDASSSTDSWTNEQDGTVCDDDGCTIYACEDGQCVEDDQKDCDDGNPCTENSCEDGECVFDPDPMDDEVCDDDGLGCTSHTCDAGACVESIDDGCLIDGECRDDGEIHVSAECFYCDPDESTDSWSPRPEGDPCDNGLFCTEGDSCDGSGQCIAGDDYECEDVQCYDSVQCSNAASACLPTGPQTGTSCDIDDGLDCTSGLCDSGSCTAEVTQGCLIDGVCWDDGEPNPDNDCQVCDSNESETSWSDREDGSSCEPGDGLDCTTGSCDAGSCSAEVTQGCLIDGACWDDGDVNPDNDCQVCSSADSATSWSNASDGTSCDPGDGLECTGGSCSAGVCDVEIEQGCLIDGTCYDSGADHPTDPCQACVPTQQDDGWSAGNEGEICDAPYCSDENESTMVSVCDDQGTCLPSDDDIEDCEDYLCDTDTGECLTSCEDDDDCYGDAYCEGDECTTRPIADAGDDQVVLYEQEVTLDGSASIAPGAEGDVPETYDWIQIDGVDVDLENDDTANPTFFAPDSEAADDPSEGLELQFELVVGYGDEFSEPDDTVVQVTPDADEPPVAIIEGDDEADADETVTLDGTDSYHPDGLDIDHYSWNWEPNDDEPSPTITQTDIGEESRVDVSFPYEEIEEQKVYTIVLTVRSGQVNSPTTEHDIVVNPVDLDDPGDDVGVEPDPSDDVGVTDAGEDDRHADPNIEGSGCACSTGGGDGVPASMLVVFALAAAAVWGRREAVMNRRARRA